MVLVGLTVLGVGVVILLRRPAARLEADPLVQVPMAARHSSEHTESLQSKPLTPAALCHLGVVVPVWAVGCMNCINNLSCKDLPEKDAGQTPQPDEDGIQVLPTTTVRATRLPKPSAPRSAGLQTDALRGKGRFHTE